MILRIFITFLLFSLMGAFIYSWGYVRYQKRKREKYYKQKEN